MGFRFQKRIKLGKGLGITISKSGVTPSYRNKKGAISSKGFTIKTGVPGLSYRKTFKKAKGRGCLVVLVFAIVIPIFGLLGGYISYGSHGTKTAKLTPLHSMISLKQHTKNLHHKIKNH